jgi:parallel beta-helix repeat protein
VSILGNNADGSAGVNPDNQNGGWQEVPNTQNQGYKIDVTPNNPFKAPEQAPQAPAPAVARKKQKTKFPIKYLAIAIAVIFIAVIVLATLHKPTAVTTITTSIKSSVYTLSACGVVSAPGSYYINSDIKTNITDGSCIAINSSDVNLVCNGKSITGSGPYSNKTPYTYAISVDGRKNVFINGCTLSDFSYAITADNSTGIKISNNNVYNNTMSGIYFSNTSLSSISNNKVSGSSGPQGAIFIGNNSFGNKIINNSVVSNGAVGISVYSSGEGIYNNYINATPTSFACSGLSGLINASAASGNRCDINSGCNFLSCNAINYPINVSQIHLSNVLDSCGVIDAPGNYHVSQSINAGLYLKAKGALSSEPGTSCIKIQAPDVHLDCGGNNITNVSFGYAISSVSEQGLEISHCGIYSSKGGILLENITGANVSYINISSVGTGIKLSNSNKNILSNVDATGSKIGIYINSSTLDTFDYFGLSGNGYGIYINNSIGDVYSNGYAQDNSRMDIYATNNSIQSGYSLMSNTRCGLTDAQWTTCTDVTKPQLKYYTVNSCIYIRYAGNYSLSQSILATSPKCIDIAVSNVRLSCSSNRISAQNKGSGIAIFANGVSNVTINNCSVDGSKYGYYLRNVSNSTISYGSASQNVFGVYLNGSKGITISNFAESDASGAGIVLNSSKNNNIVAGTFSSGAYGMSLYNSTNNIILGNGGSGDAVGMHINTNSTNNTIVRNNFTGSSSYDYLCSGAASGVSSEYGGINYGQKTSNCRWLSAISPNAAPIACNAYFSSSSYSIGSDGYYSLGALCNGIYANSTTINCNYNTITATNGGTFAEFSGVKGGLIEDCILRGFSKAIIIKNSSVKALNDVIYVNATGSSSSIKNFGVGVYSSKNFQINNITVISNSTGILIENSLDGVISNANVTARQISYYVSNTVGTTFKNNIAVSPGIGISMQNSTTNSFSNNHFNGTIGGALCQGTSTNSSSNLNSGSNYCSINVNCPWFGGSNC